MRTLTLLPLCAALLLLAVGCTTPARIYPRQTLLPAHQVQVDLQSIHGLPAWPMERLPKHPDGVLLIDTGAEMVAFSEPLARRIFALLEKTDRRSALAAGRALPVTHEFNIQQFKIKDARFDEFRVMTMQLDPLSESLGVPVHGVLGFGLFRDCVMTLDYPRRQMTLSRAPITGSGGNVLPMRFVPGDACPRVQVQINDQPVWARIETANPHGLCLPRALVDRLILQFTTTAAANAPALPEMAETPPAASPQLRLAGSLQIAGERIDQPPVTVIDGDVTRLGVAVLDRFALSFDQRRGVLAVTRSQPRMATR